MKQLDVTAVKENRPKVIGFVTGMLEEAGCGFMLITQVEVAVEEIFANIVNYAYAPEVGTATVKAGFAEDTSALVVSFIDRGKPYDPLSAPEPDKSIPLKQRKKGGMGIFMVKRTMDEMTYEYKDGQNILTIKKNISRGENNG